MVNKIGVFVVVIVLITAVVLITRNVLRSIVEDALKQVM